MLGASEVPEFLGEAALVDGFDGADGQGVGGVPAAAVAFEAEGFALALGFGGAAADVATGGAEFGVCDQGAAVADVIDQAGGGFCGTSRGCRTRR